MATAVMVKPRRHPFEYTATGVLGDKRNTMLSNELHLRVCKINAVLVKINKTNAFTLLKFK